MPPSCRQPLRPPSTHMPVPAMQPHSHVRTEPLPSFRQAWKKDQGLTGSEMVEFLADKDGPLTNALEP